MKTKRLVSLAIFVALSVMLHYVESFIPAFLPIPGFRLGLANIILLFVLYYYDSPSYIFTMILKVLLVASISSGFSVQFFMSLGGSLSSMVITLILYHLVKPSIYATSALSALGHSLGQLFVYSLFFYSFYIFSYLLILGPLSLFTGCIMALLCSILIKRIPASFRQDEKVRR